MSEEFYRAHIHPHTGIIVKICRAYSWSQDEFDDYFQEVCLQLWKSRHKFQNRSKWSTWVYRVALNVCMSLARKHRHTESWDEKHNALQTEENQAFENEDIAQLYRAIRRLSEADRAVILLYLEEKSYAEIAEVLGTNVNNIGVKINRIKERLKKLLDGTLN